MSGEDAVPSEGEPLPGKPAPAKRQPKTLGVSLQLPDRSLLLELDHARELATARLELGGRT